MDITEVQRNLKAYDEGEKPIRLTPRRLSALRQCLNDNYTILNVGSYGVSVDGVREHSFGERELMGVGEMEFLLNAFFPDGNVPVPLKKFQEYVTRVKEDYGVEYNDAVERKMQRDAHILQGTTVSGAVLDEIDNLVYARSVVHVIEADKVAPDKSTLVVRYEGEPLYGGDIPNGAFDELPGGSTAVFNYVPGQGLELDLAESLELSKDVKNSSAVEKVLISSTATSIPTRRFLDDILDQINEEGQ